jgi:hypothetical protein
MLRAPIYYDIVIHLMIIIIIQAHSMAEIAPHACNTIASSCGDSTKTIIVFCLSHTLKH